MCVEKNERATDSKVKTAIQNILGGMVLGSLPAVALGLLYLWNGVDVAVNDIDHLLKRVDGIERKHEEFQRWKDETNGNRFRWTDGELLRQAIAGNTQNLLQLEKSVTEHNRNAEKYIEKIQQMEKKSHYHSWQVESDR